LLLVVGTGHAYTDLGGGVCTCNSCSDCSDALNNNTNCTTEVRLTTDINNVAGTCVNNPENFSNKIFDCQGHLIDGDSSGNDYGIYLSGKENNTIRNCNISDFLIDVYLSSCSNITLMNNTAYQNPGGLSNSVGFNIRNSSNSKIINNSAYSNTQYGFYLSFTSSNNKLSGNDAYDNDVSGFYIAGASNNNNLTNNSASGNPYGFTIDQSSYNILSDNIGWNNSHGFYVVDSSGGRNILRNNTARDNNFEGIFVHNSQTNVFSGNIVCNNSRYGFYINSSSYSNITDNIVCNNSWGQALITYSNTNMYIYNNVFNASTGQGVVTDDNGTNYWNTTKDCSRTNIIGGKCVGGNWYSDYSGVDYNNDSIGDDPPNYTIPGLGSIDYLPLTSNYTPICYMPAGAGVCDVLLSNCSCIEEALNNNSCSEVRLTVDITDWAGTCVNNPENFSNKILDCQGYTIDGDGSGVDY
jgi:parallel beta-helix repeat protein